MERKLNIIPRALVLHLTQRCNSRCPHCLWVLRDPNFFHTDTSLDMPLEKAKEIIDYYYNLGVRRIKLQAEGEVFLYKDLKNLTEYCLNKGFRDFGIATNGIDLDKHIDFILSYIGYISISIDGYNAETYIKHRGGTEAVFDRITSNVKMLAQRQKKCKIYINSVIHNKNFKQAVRCVKLAESLEVDLIKFRNYHPVGAEDKLKPVSPKNLKYIRNMFRKRHNKIRIRVPRIVPIKGPFYCVLPFKVALVSYKYNMSPCCHIDGDPKWGMFSTESDPHNSVELGLFRTQIADAKNISDLPEECRECGRLQKTGG